MNVNTPFLMSVEHDGANTNSYNFIEVAEDGSESILGTVMKADVQNNRPGWTDSGRGEGTYRFLAEAVGPGGTKRTAPTALTVTAAAPSDFVGDLEFTAVP